MSRLPESRKEAVRRLGRYLRRWRQPHLVLFTVLILTGIVGAVSSFLMLRLGLGQMWLRYPIAAFIAYGVFLLFLHIWRDQVLRRSEFAAEIERMTDEAEAIDHSNDQTTKERPQPKGSLLEGLNPLDFLDIPDDPWSFLFVAIIALFVVALIIYETILILLRQI